ncbi:MAG: hypothetical protein V3U75_03990 [Methylococcaceae bacterium]
MTKPILLSICEMGGYPDFSSLYLSAGYDTYRESSMRKAMSFIKKMRPEIIVAEFNFQSDFRDRTSSLESMMSIAQRLSLTKVIVFYDKEYEHQFSRLLARHTFYRTFAFPIPEDDLARCIQPRASDS